MTEIRIPSNPSTDINLSNWSSCIGTGHMALALQREYQDALAVIQSEIGFQYIRGHGLLSDLMGVYRKEYWPFNGDQVKGSPGLNFTYVDQVYDTFLDHGIRPFVEIGFMPGDMASGEKTHFYWAGNVTPPSDYTQWRTLLQDLVRHLVNRYGREEVVKWPFEIWNEPDAPKFWSEDQEGYFKLYRESALAIKEVDADIRVGGPATCPNGTNWVTPFLDMCDAQQVPVDFVSTHSYYGQDSDFVGEYVYQTLHDRPFALDQFRQARQLVDQSSMPELPLHITEYNTSWSPRGPIHDTAFNAAFLGYLLSHGGDFADSYSYWTFSDVFEENDIPRSIFHGGFGLLAHRCIRKPTFHLFSFFSKLRSLPLYRDDASVVTRGADGSVALVAWNPVAEQGGEATLDLAYSIPFAHPAAVVKKQVVNEEYGNAWSAWKEMGRPRNPTHGQIDTLHHAATPALDVSQAAAENGTLLIQHRLQRNEIVLIEIAPRVDESDSYLGLDDARIPGYG